MDLQWNGNEMQINDELAALMKAVGDGRDACLRARRADVSLMLFSSLEKFMI